ncbi:hypothetical protein EW145_g5216 [Phellinidium pouzarii]|uniref:Uncharacterized protein n=1 Tax=Phellinidium pouzarii TaxID=167371 RepID=A0A4S4L196_9AGAM|nr:hypothetical protein EW145_g5216 [Phellinidium pouzarii]
MHGTSHIDEQTGGWMNSTGVCLHTRLVLHQRRKMPGRRGFPRARSSAGSSHASNCISHRLGGLLADWNVFDGPPKSASKSSASRTITDSQQTSKRPKIVDDDYEGSSTSKDSSEPGESTGIPVIHDGWISRYTYDPTQDFSKLRARSSVVSASGKEREKPVQQARTHGPETPSPFVALPLSQQTHSPPQRYNQFRRSFPLKESNVDLFKRAGQPVDFSSKKRNVSNTLNESGKPARQVDVLELKKMGPYVRTMILSQKVADSAEASGNPMRQESNETNVAGRKAVSSTKEPSNPKFPNSSRKTFRRDKAARRAEIINPFVRIKMNLQKAADLSKTSESDDANMVAVSSMKESNNPGSSSTSGVTKRRTDEIINPFVRRMMNSQKAVDSSVAFGKNARQEISSTSGETTETTRSKPISLLRSQLNASVIDVDSLDL